MAGESRTFETLFPGSRRTVLATLFIEPSRWCSVEELAGRAGVRPSSIQPYVLRLKENGIIRESWHDGRRAFQPNPECQIFAELQAIVMKLTAVSGGETIMVVEDTAATAQVTRILLESWGYRALEAHSPAEALNLFDSRTNDIHLVLTDVIMPEMTGQDLAIELRKRDPSVRIVFMSGYPDQELPGLDGMFLAKPFNPAGLSQMVRKALDGEPHHRVEIASRKRIKAP